ncbi:hypothetical protein DXN05_04830 [Deminuibacter soli]|uniref:Uncharacterized protein n=1 Tax=Deminuibacter soli TaxID=2291815 RepID=A0A3E1NQU1_9BACT|nr:hypothetical protein DXN05_04830 [Deminuibacter soli]
MLRGMIEKRISLLPVAMLLQNVHIKAKNGCSFVFLGFFLKKLTYLGVSAVTLGECAAKCGF